MIISGREITLRESKECIKVFANEREIPANLIINSAGVHADQLAQKI